MNHLSKAGIVLLGLLTAFATASARSMASPETKQVDLVIALDVSGSMNGLLDSARQRLWDIVNDLGQASPQPELRVAIVSFGKPGYGQQTGYVRVDQALTSDLDAVNQTLFGFRTGGGEEYVARAIQTAVQQLDWSRQPGALKLLFVAGNESALQDPQVSVQQATRMALDQDIVVNTIYCGGANDSDATSWQTVAGLTQGVFASIDQGAAAIANVATPQDEALATLNRKLNSTYIPYGDQGRSKRANQLEQDDNVASMSAPAAASRTVTKASSMYDASRWDLVDAVQSGTELEALAEADLPAEMQDMDQEQRRDYVAVQTEERARLKEEIGALSKQRQQFIEQRQEGSDASQTGLDKAIATGLRVIADRKGLVLDGDN